MMITFAMKLKNTYIMMFPITKHVRMSLKWVFPLKSSRKPRTKEMMMGPDRSGDSTSSLFTYPSVSMLMNLFFIRLMSNPMSKSTQKYPPEEADPHHHHSLCFLPGLPCLLIGQTWTHLMLKFCWY